MKLNPGWWKDLPRLKRNIYSQAGEDGVIGGIFRRIGVTNKFCVDIGAGNGVRLSNTKNLRDKGWNSFLVEANVPPRFKDEIHEAFVTAENINQILEEGGVPDEPDLMSIDIDGNDFYVWKALKIRPRVLVIEYNRMHPYSTCVAMPYDPKWVHDRTCFFGASLLAMKHLGRKLTNMELVAHTAPNAFFVRRDICGPINIPFAYPVGAGWGRDKKRRKWLRISL